MNIRILLISLTLGLQSTIQSQNLNESAWLLLTQNQYQAALEKFNASIQDDSTNLPSLIGSSMAYQAIVKDEEVKRLLVKAITLQQSSDLYYLAGLNALYLKDFASGKNYFKRALELDSKASEFFTADCHFHHANSLLGLKAYQEAVAEYTLALALEPENEHYLYNRAMANLMAGNAEEGCKDFQLAKTIDESIKDDIIPRYCRGIDIDLKLTDSLANELKMMGNIYVPLQRMHFPEKLQDTLYYNSSSRLTVRKSSSQAREISFSGFRVAHIDNNKNIVGRDFQDYYLDGMLQGTGSYNADGQKHGRYSFFYHNGSLLARGSFRYGKMIGEWSFFDEYHRSAHTIKIDNGTFEVVQSKVNDVTNLKDGNGKWTIEIKGYVLNGEYEDGLRHGEWTIRDHKHNLLITETYKKGNLTKSKNHQEPHDTPIGFDAESLFYPASLDSMELIISSGTVTRREYPYFDQLPITTANSRAQERKSMNKTRWHMRGIYDLVEEQPRPANGMKGFYEYIAKNMIYPSSARLAGIQGKVFVQFVIDEQGAVTNIKVIKGIGGGCNEEAIRVIQNSPLWTPGKKDGRPVKVRMILPITFKLPKLAPTTMKRKSF